MKKNGKPYFPMFVDLTDKKVVIAGAGTIAKRRIRSMIEFTDHLYVIAPEVNKELKEMEEAGKLTILRKTYEREDLYDASLVIAATNDHKINQDIYAACKCLGIPVNVCQDRDRCDFYFPGTCHAGQPRGRREHKRTGKEAAKRNCRAAAAVFR